MTTLFENATLLDVEAGVLRPGTSVVVDGERIAEVSERPVDLLVVDGDPLRDITLLDGQGEHLVVVMRGGHPFRRNGT